MASLIPLICSNFVNLLYPLLACLNCACSGYELGVRLRGIKLNVIYSFLLAIADIDKG